MKKIVAMLLSLSMLVVLGACSGKTNPEETTSNTAMKEKLDSMEYAAYQNIFMNDQASDYENKEYTKDGIFTVIRDEFNGVDRYYVWGYADQTKCCDFQWELVLPEGTEIPSSGSYVSVTGTLKYDEAALDKYWFTDCTLTVEQTYKGADYDYDLTTMSATLERVQILNMEYKPDAFNGKTVLVYGRALNTSSIQNPYYDNSWSLDFKYDGAAPATGDSILVGGVFTAEGTGCYVQATLFEKK